MFVHTSGIQNITNLVISTESFIYYNTTYDVMISYYYILLLYYYLHNHINHDCQFFFRLLDSH